MDDDDAKTALQEKLGIHEAALYAKCLHEGLGARAAVLKLLHYAQQKWCLDDDQGVLVANLRELCQFSLCCAGGQREREKKHAFCRLQCIRMRAEVAEESVGIARADAGSKRWRKDWSRRTISEFLYFSKILQGFRAANCNHNSEYADVCESVKSFISAF